MPLFNAKELIPPHRITRVKQVIDLARGMREHGWQGPPLIAYKRGGQIQLLSGTHRRAAAQLSKTPVPVLLYGQEEVEAIWGNLEQWTKLMNGELP